MNNDKNTWFGFNGSHDICALGGCADESEARVAARSTRTRRDANYIWLFNQVTLKKWKIFLSTALDYIDSVKTTMYTDHYFTLTRDGDLKSLGRHPDSREATFHSRFNGGAILILTDDCARRFLYSLNDLIVESEGDRVVFALTELKGVIQQDQLGITGAMYRARTSTKTDKWRAALAEKVNSAQCSDELKTTALHNLNELYKQIRRLT